MLVYVEIVYIPSDWQAENIYRNIKVLLQPSNMGVVNFFQSLPLAHLKFGNLFP